MIHYIPFLVGSKFIGVSSVLMILAIRDKNKGMVIAVKNRMKLFIIFISVGLGLAIYGWAIDRFITLSREWRGSIGSLDYLGERR